MGKIGNWPDPMVKRVKRKLTAFVATLVVMGSLGLAIPAVASAYSSWWAYTNGGCRAGSSYSTSYFYRTWYKVIDYNWYEEATGKIDYNYPTLYYPDHADKIYGCSAA